jgi:hexosaminidase
VEVRRPRQRADPLDSLVALKRIITFCAIALVVAVAVFAALNSVRLILPGSAAPNPAPHVIPALRQWRGKSGSFAIRAASRITLDPASAGQLTETARVFQADMAQVAGRTLPVVTTDSPDTGDFYLSLRTAATGLGDEGYVFDVNDTVSIYANTSTGVFYGTRTALQILAEDPQHATIPRGTAQDYPQYKERGFMLDVGRKFFPIQFLEDYVRFMAWFKMNDFHIHFNDNAFDVGKTAGWMQGYAAFRLNSNSFPGLAAKDGSYTEADIRALEDVAHQYDVTITPEIDAPSHDLALTQYRPDLASPSSDKEFLNLGDPATFTFLNSLWDTFLPWFDAPQVSIGADEYTAGDPNTYRAFINTYDAYLKAKGKTIHVWGSLSLMGGSLKVNSDVVMELWDNQWQNPVDTVRQGYDVINANDSLLYIVPRSTDFHDYLDTQLLYDKWEPNIFDLNNPSMNLAPNDPHLLGGEFAEWNDNYASITIADVHSRVKPAMPVIAEKLWSGPATPLPYSQFMQLAGQLGTGPGTHLPAG